MKFFDFFKGRGGIFASFAVLLLAACTVVETGPGPGPRPPFPGGPGGPGMCTREYAPVCGIRGGDRQTFPNACVARSEGYRVVSDGQCRSGGGGPRPPVACTQQYDPVCGERRGQRQTFGNSCIASAEGFRVVSRGECRGAGGIGGGGGRPPAMACTREYAPVCARRGGHVRTFGNACEAESARYQIVGRGECR
ncbi:Kazal-type serine protease inhibitor domain-containing protein [Aquamicrobium sp. LC103]|uniref:Kazal-type serine protease inhibitor domain-containing protein n=1 Tax=Aquamicrobium sp. LC103 TaxID=1120658 RepID=UPI00063E827C|nr:Kazal-type serine protease inhibitor domain-containing protein [Aquamicrobium sp. LC103]TKT74982.1 hypothetical protein XW59_021155 [Aquamicrobium sp. LC103]